MEKGEQRERQDMRRRVDAVLPSPLRIAYQLSGWSGPLFCRMLASGYTFGPALKKGPRVSYLTCICVDDWRYTWALAVHSLFCAEGVVFFSSGIVLDWSCLATRHHPAAFSPPPLCRMGQGGKKGWERTHVLRPRQQDYFPTTTMGKTDSV